MRTAATLAVAMLLTFPCAARADKRLDAARRQTRLAKLRLDVAEARLRGAVADQIRADRELDKARDAGRQLERAFDDLQRRADRLPGEIRRLEGDMDRLARQANDAADAVKPKFALASAAVAQLAARTKEATAQRSRLTAQFETGAEHQAAAAAVGDAEAKVKAAHDARMAALRREPAFAQAFAAYENAKARVAQLKAQPNTAGTPPLAEASLAVIQMEKVAARLRIAALKDDPALTAAETELKNAELELVALRKTFDDALPGMPAMAVALRRLAAANDVADRANDEFKQVKAAADAADARYTAARDELTRLQRALRDADDDLARLDRQRRDAQDEAARLERVVRDLDRVIRGYRTDVDLLHRRYLDARRFEDRIRRESAK